MIRRSVIHDPRYSFDVPCIYCMSYFLNGMLFPIMFMKMEFRWFWILTIAFPIYIHSTCNVFPSNNPKNKPYWGDNELAAAWKQRQFEYRYTWILEEGNLAWTLCPRRQTLASWYHLWKLFCRDNPVAAIPLGTSFSVSQPHCGSCQHQQPQNLLCQLPFRFLQR
jgi:hypothetical protein